MSSSSSDNASNKRQRSEGDGNRNDKGGKKEEWKDSPPYAAKEDKQKDRKALFTGNCHCGDVQFEIYVDKPKGSHYCQ